MQNIRYTHEDSTEQENLENCRKMKVNKIVIRKRNVWICLGSILVVYLLKLGSTPQIKMEETWDSRDFITGADEHIPPSGLKMWNKRILLRNSGLLRNTPNTVSSKGPVKVLLMTYMRSGSTFTGQLFNQNPDAFYWFEPLDGVFSSLYGTPLAALPIDITQYHNGSDRIPPKHEVYEFNNAMLHILNCDTARLPIEVTLHDFLLSRIKGSAPKYIDCFKAKVQRRKRGQIPATIMHGCKKYISRLCGREKGYDAWNMCYKWLNYDSNTSNSYELDAARDIYINSTSQNSHMELHNTVFNKFRGVTLSMFKYIQQSLLSTFKSKSKPIRSIRSYYSCMAEFQDVFTKCSPSLSEECSSTKICVAKVIRLPMENAANILKQDPTIHTPDPRAVVHSRLKAKLISFYTRRKSNEAETRLVDEAEILCRKMRKDIEIRHSLEKLYPNRFKEIRYEDIVQNPIHAYREIYQFLGIDVSKEVELWIDRNTHAQTSDDAFGTRRHNSTETAFQWETDVTHRTVKLIT